MPAAQGYIGRNPADSSTVIARQSFSPTGIQTDFTFAAGYDVGYVDLYLNGARLIEGQDFTATDGSTVGLTTNAVNGDVLELVAFKAFNATNVTASGGNFAVAQNLTVGGTAEVTGAITATGGVVGNVTGDATGLSGTPDITVRHLKATGISTVSDTTQSTTTTSGALIVSGGLGVAKNLFVGGSMNVGGTLTYEDVTNSETPGITTTGGLVVTGLGATFGSGVGIADSIYHIDDSNTAIRFPAADTFTVETAGSERLRIDSAGRMGLGVSPSDFGSNRTALEIHSPSATVTHLALTNSTTGSNGTSNGFNIIQNGNDALLYLRESGFMSFSTNNEERLRITSAGGALIGGHTTAVDGGNAPNIEIVNTSTSTLSLARNDTSISNGNDIAAIRVWGNDSNGTYQQCAEILAEADGDHGTGDKPTALAFKVTADGASSPTERLRITSGGGVGIGTTNPVLGRLQVERDIGIYRASSDPTLNFAVGGTIDSPTKTYRILIDDSDNDKFQVRDSSTARITLDGSGNIGINETSPNTQLVVKGASNSTTNSVGNINVISSDSAAINLGGSIGLGGFYNGTSNSIPFANLHGKKENGTNNNALGYFAISTRDASGTSEKFRIDSSGRLLVGTQTPGATAGEQLTIADSANAGITIRSGTTSAGSILFEDDTADRGEIQYSHNGDFLRIKTAGTEKLRITSGGNIGINEDDPTADLSITGANGSTMEFQPDVSSGTNRITNFNRSTSTYKAFRLDASQQEFYISGTERFRITSDGQHNFKFVTSQTPRTYANGSHEGLMISVDRDDNSNFLGTIDFAAGRASDGSNGGTQFRFWTQPRSTGAAAERLRIQSDGNIKIFEHLGIGQDPSGSYPLVVTENTRYQIAINNSGADQNYPWFVHDDVSSASALLIHFNSIGDRFTFKENGDFIAVGNVTAYSDVSLKENIETVPNALDKVLNLRGVYFDKKDQPDVPRQMGVIAQEVEEVVPEVVSTGADEMKTVAYGNLVGLLIESIKELKAEVNDLKAQVEG